MNRSLIILGGLFVFILWALLGFIAVNDQFNIIRRAGDYHAAEFVVQSVRTVEGTLTGHGKGRPTRGPSTCFASGTMDGKPATLDLVPLYLGVLGPFAEPSAMHNLERQLPPGTSIALKIGPANGNTPGILLDHPFWYLRLLLHLGWLCLSFFSPLILLLLYIVFPQRFKLPTRRSAKSPPPSSPPPPPLLQVQINLRDEIRLAVERAGFADQFARWQALIQQRAVIAEEAKGLATRIGFWERLKILLDTPDKARERELQRLDRQNRSDQFALQQKWTTFLPTQRSQYASFEIVCRVTELDAFCTRALLQAGPDAWADCGSQISDLEKTLWSYYCSEGDALKVLLSPVERKQALNPIPHSTYGWTPVSLIDLTAMIARDPENPCQLSQLQAYPPLRLALELTRLRELFLRCQNQTERYLSSSGEPRAYQIASLAPLIVAQLSQLKLTAKAVFPDTPWHSEVAAWCGAAASEQPISPPGRENFLDQFNLRFPNSGAMAKFLGALVWGVQATVSPASVGFWSPGLWDELNDEKAPAETRTTRRHLAQEIKVRQARAALEDPPAWLSLEPANEPAATDWPEMQDILLKLAELRLLLDYRSSQSKPFEALRHTPNHELEVRDRAELAVQEKRLTALWEQVQAQARNLQQTISDDCLQVLIALNGLSAVKTELKGGQACITRVNEARQRLRSFCDCPPTFYDLVKHTLAAPTDSLCSHLAEKLDLQKIGGYLKQWEMLRKASEQADGEAAEAQSKISVWDRLLYLGDSPKVKLSKEVKEQATHLHIEADSARSQLQALFCGELGTHPPALLFYSTEDLEESIKELRVAVGSYHKSGKGGGNVTFPYVAGRLAATLSALAYASRVYQEYGALPGPLGWMTREIANPTPFIPT